MGAAYAGPSTLNLRKELGSRSAIVGTAKHGERLDVLETRRRFVRVRTSTGAEGWTDLNLLLTESQMEDLRRLAESAKKLPSQGAATVYEALNIHAEPYRQSPSFFQIPEGGMVEVVGHIIAPHNPPPSPIPATRHKAAVPKKKSKSAPFPLPLPAPPPVPPDLMELSRSSIPPPPPAPVPTDDWALVRTKTGDAGWALERMLVMSIPDEVAQYAEGHRITAYLPLGEVYDKDKNQTKQNWLWTTASFNQRPYEFDSFRVFVFSLKHHRYETAYIERNVKGYYPVEAVSLPGDDEKAFSVVLEDKNGQRNRCTYAFSGYRVRLVSKVPYEAAAPTPEQASSAEASTHAAPASKGWSDRLRTWRKKWLGR
ncbi:MAG TPA: SH3 domain-containing protein [Bryobacteraceae bacterium]